MAELDGDGRTDAIALTERLLQPVATVQLGHALPWLPQLVPAGTTTASNRPRALAVADFDRDGAPDLAASGLDGLQVLHGGPQAVLLPDRESVLRAAQAGGLQLGDVDGDGRDELVALGRGGDVGLGKFDRAGAWNLCFTTCSMEQMRGRAKRCGRAGCCSTSTGTGRRSCCGRSRGTAR
ncbi:VCBS repeat-containing protein [Nannocystis pusilla]|uniref:VCBS repeat-containing protein n=1 Tax=Nannocystis pusilla TaxID=889268 RepID=A0A9X3J2S1_9BACT|nr:VCBS repeat-containing protein [Nannocystis pusilla]